jgi:hypothetical protein
MSLVVRGVATYEEIMRFWDIDELMTMHEILDIQADIEADETERLKAKMATKGGHR